MFQARLNLYAGPGCLAWLAEAAGSSRIMVATDAGCDRAGILDHVLTALLPVRPVGVCAFLAAEPTFTDVSRVCEAIAADRPGCLVAVGGGSAIDLAKAAAALATNGGSVRTYATSSYSGYRADALHSDPLPVVAIPTTAGTGSEVTRNAAISDPVTGDKLAMRSPRLVPRAQFLDPGPLRTCPASVAAQAGLDAAAHALEGMSSTLASPASDELAVDAVRRLVTALPGFCRAPADPDLAMQMQIGSLLAGLVLNDCATVAGHALARAIGAAAKLAHGLSVALVIAEVVRLQRRRFRPQAWQYGGRARPGSRQAGRLHRGRHRGPARFPRHPGKAARCGRDPERACPDRRRRRAIHRAQPPPRGPGGVARRP